MGDRILLLCLFVVLLRHGDLCAGRSTKLDHDVISSKQHDFSSGWTKPTGAILFTTGSVKAYKNSENWGYCKENQFAKGLALSGTFSVMGSQTGEPELVCGSQYSSSSRLMKCREGEVLIGFQIKSAGGVLEEIRLQCFGSGSGKTWIGPPGGKPAHGWKPVKSCPPGQAICGIWKHLQQDELAFRCCTLKHSLILRSRESRSELSKFAITKFHPPVFVANTRPRTTGTKNEAELSCKKKEKTKAQNSNSKSAPSKRVHSLCVSQRPLGWEKIREPKKKFYAYDQTTGRRLYPTLQPELNEKSCPSFFSCSFGDFRSKNVDNNDERAVTRNARNIKPTYNLLWEKPEKKGQVVRLKQIDIVTSTLPRAILPKKVPAKAFFAVGTRTTDASRKAIQQKGNRQTYSTQSGRTLPTEEAGHLLSNLFGGFGHIPDLVLPMDKMTNLDMRDIDREILKDAVENCVGTTGKTRTCDLEVSIKPLYDEIGNFPRRPSSMLIRYRLLVKVSGELPKPAGKYKYFNIDNSYDAERYKKNEKAEATPEVRLFVLLSNLS